MFRTAAKKTRKRRPPGRGALFAISVLLIGSALVRIGGDAGQAWAKTSKPMDMADANEEYIQQTCEAPSDLQPMLTAFQEREERIATQEAALEDRLQALKFANREIDRKLAELEAAEETLRETIALADTAAESDLDRLTRVYENMKPKQTAALFEEMDPNFAAGFLGRMRPEAAAAVMAGLSPEAAHTFSVVLAGRNANVPTE